MQARSEMELLSFEFFSPDHSDLLGNGIILFEFFSKYSFLDLPNMYLHMIYSSEMSQLRNANGNVIICRVVVFAPLSVNKRIIAVGDLFVSDDVKHFR